MTIQHSCTGWETGNPEQWKFGAAGAGISVSTLAARTETYGLLISPSAQSPTLNRQFGAGITRSFLGRFYFRFPTSLPTGAAKTFGGIYAALTAVDPSIRWVFDPADNKLHAQRFVSGSLDSESVGPVLAADTWYRVDFRNAGANHSSPTFQWSVDGVAQSTLTNIGGVIQWQWGRGASQTFTVHVDDITMLYTQDDADDETVDAAYPIGAGAVKRLAVVANGANQTESAFGTSAGSIADSWQLLDNLPMLSSASYVEQTTLDTGAYLGYTYADLPAADTTIQAVSVINAIKSSGLSANDAKVRIIDGASDDLLRSGIWLSTGTTLENEEFMFGWPFTRERVNALVMRWGLSGDVISIPRLGSTHLEVSVGTPAADATTGAPAEKATPKPLDPRWYAAPHRFRNLQDAA